MVSTFWPNVPIDDPASYIELAKYPLIPLPTAVNIYLAASRSANEPWNLGAQRPVDSGATS